VKEKKNLRVTMGRKAIVAATGGKKSETGKNQRKNEETKRNYLTGAFLEKKGSCTQGRNTKKKEMKTQVHPYERGRGPGRVKYWLN